jgi:hypothetical protein
MNKLIGLIRREPVAVQAFIQATLALLVGFGVVTVTNEQTGLILGAFAALLALVTRMQVSPKSTQPTPAPQAEPTGDAT